MSNLERTLGSSAGTAASALEVKAEVPGGDKLRVLAAQFEALLLGQMLREMRESMFDDGESTGFNGGGLADQVFAELSNVLGRAGGLGLARSVTAPLARQAGDDLASLSAGDDRAGLVVPASPTRFELASAVDRSVAEAVRPLAGRVSSNYGWRRDPISGDRTFHKGADIAMPLGQDVPVARPGRVSFAGELDGYGLTAVVDHGDGMSTRYAHLSEVEVSVGEVVGAGQVIARSGASGRATGPHLHFEVLADGRPVDPSSWLGAWRR